MAANSRETLLHLLGTAAKHLDDGRYVETEESRYLR